MSSFGFRKLLRHPSAITAVAACSTWYIVATSTSSGTNATSSCDAPPKTPKLVFLGTGSSTGCPKQLCTMLFQATPSKDPEIIQLQAEHRHSCQTSIKAVIGDPKSNKDYRNNPSLLISHYEGGAKHAHNVIIDVGKTFREAAIRWMPQCGIRSVDAVILTHHHMDAVAGLDDLRGFQKVIGLGLAPRPFNIHHAPPVRVPIPIFLSQPCYDQVSLQFPWLFPKQTNALPGAVPRDVASLKVHVIQHYKPFTAAGLKVIPLPVLHGDDLISLGFAMSITGKHGTPVHVLYISDISKMIPETLTYIRTQLPPTDILIVDALLPGIAHHPVHYNLHQAIELSKELQPTQHTYLVGMSCDAFLPHDEMNQTLHQKHPSISLAHDGLEMEL